MCGAQFAVGKSSFCLLKIRSLNGFLVISQSTLTLVVTLNFFFLCGGRAALACVSVTSVTHHDGATFGREFLAGGNCNGKKRCQRCHKATMSPGAAARTARSLAPLALSNARSTRSVVLVHTGLPAQSPRRVARQRTRTLQDLPSQDLHRDAMLFLCAMQVSLTVAVSAAVIKRYGHGPGRIQEGCGGLASSCTSQS